MTLTCSSVKVKEEEEGENGMIIGRTGRWNWEFGEKIAQVKKMELHTVRIVQVSFTFNCEYDRISNTEHSYIPRQPTKYTKR